MVKVAINGFGEIGRLFFRKTSNNKDVKIVAINDLGSIEVLAYLLRVDFVTELLNTNVINTKNALIVDGEMIPVYSENLPQNLPWKELDIDVVFECTEASKLEEKISAHIQAGAKKIIISSL